MTTNSLYQWQLVVVIVNAGQASRVIRLGKSVGITGGTIVLGRGTLRRPLLQLLELADYRREIVLMVAESPTIVQATFHELKTRFNIEKPHHGIAVAINVSHFLGTGSYDYQQLHESEDVIMKHQAIFVILDKGKADAAMKIAGNAGAMGGTIINARGSGIHEAIKLFQMAIEPEKEILLIISATKDTENIVSAIKTGLDIEKPGNGIIFVQDVKDAIGLRESK